MLNLADRHLVIVRGLLAQHVPGRQVLAYGSRANGSSHDGSDLDIVVINAQDPETPTTSCAQLRDAFAESDLPICVDVHDWADLPQSFREDINASPHVVLQR